MCVGGRGVGELPVPITAAPLLGERDMKGERGGKIVRRREKCLFWKFMVQRRCIVIGAGAEIEWTEKRRGKSTGNRMDRGESRERGGRARGRGGGGGKSRMGGLKRKGTGAQS